MEYYTAIKEKMKKLSNCQYGKSHRMLSKVRKANQEHKIKLVTDPTLTTKVLRKLHMGYWVSNTVSHRNGHCVCIHLVPVKTGQVGLPWWRSG